ncbi:MAG TPA: hypothetical protein VG323_22030 [Thermoanaerobaculia bacterium]|nr:hypothetical protein [Thermoanaerobaculia bacterium]
MSRRVAYALLIAAAAVRLLVQVWAMPPYAGLDELYHVARLAFVAQEHRNPTMSEPSVPPHLEATLERKWDAVPSFALLQADWHGPAIHDRSATTGPYARPNYEAQQPSLYYSLVAPLARLFPRTVLTELRVWRIASVVFALITILATATIGERWFGTRGIAAAALVAFIPTWETLVTRASNDAFACALVAVAIAITASGRWVVAEVLLWSLAFAAKLYTWPLAIALPFFWRWQRASRWRIVAVTAACAVSAALTLADLSARTGTALGVNFTHPGGPLRFVDLVKVAIASAAWTSGEHWDALRPLGIVLYVVPIVAAIAFSARRRDLLALTAAVLAAFALAQAVNVVKSGWAGGGEGWYWFVTVPIVVPALLAPAVKRFPLVALWIVAWDVVITLHLFRTWAGAMSPEHPTLLFRWGPHA